MLYIISKMQVLWSLPRGGGGGGTSVCGHTGTLAKNILDRVENWVLAMSY